jgi:rare lipoprotein A
MGRSGIQTATMVRFGAIAVLSLTVANCAKSNIDPKYGVAASPRVIEPGQPVPKGGGTYRVGKPYVVAGRTYAPEEDTSYAAEGLASWYGDDFHGRQTANGEVFDMNSISAAHPTLPMPSYVRVTNLRNKRSLVVRVNDRGPYHANRVIDLSVRAAKLLDFQQHGTARVKVEYVGRAALTGSDDTKLAATLRHDAPAPNPSEVMVASSKPFVPEYFDPKPMTSRGPVPPPRGRPFELGEEDRAGSPSAAPGSTIARAPLPPAAGPALASARSQPAQAPAATRTAAAEPQVTFQSRFGNTPTATPVVNSGPVSAFGPRSEGIMSGRGLY